MPNQEHVARLGDGAPLWNAWRRDSGIERPDLRHADLPSINLRRYNLKGADLEGANLHRAHLRGADLQDASLRGANLRHATLAGANLRRAHLHRAMLTKAYLRGADLTDAKLVGTNLERAVLVDAKLKGADLSMARIYGASVWDVEIDDTTTQVDLVITPPGQAVVTVDDLELAQFVYLLLRSAKIRNVLDTLGRKGVLILGRFTPPERKKVLELLRRQLRARNFVPIVFDFERAETKDFTETIMTLAGLSRFVIADITNPRSTPLELQALVPDYMIPFVPILHTGEEAFSMFENLQQKYSWVLDLLKYASPEELMEVVDVGIIRRALQKDQELLARKAEQVRTIRAADLLAGRAS